MADPSSDGQEPESASVLRERFEAQLAELKTTAERVPQLERELALHKAGLHGLTDEQVEALAVVHKGETTPEALKATAERLGWSSVPAIEAQPNDQQGPPQGQQPEPVQPATSQHLDNMSVQQLREMAALAASPAPTGQPGGPVTQEQFDKQVKDVMQELGPDGLMDWLRQNQDLIQH